MPTTLQVVTDLLAALQLAANANINIQRVVDMQTAAAANGTTLSDSDIQVLVDATDAERAKALQA